MTQDQTASLLDENLDDLADLPEFLVPPAGAYNAVFANFEEKKVGDHPAIEVKLTLNETLELSNTDDTPVAPGTETSVLYMLDNEFGVGALKAFLAPMKAAFGTVTVRQTLEAAKGAAILAVLKVKSGKKGTDAEDKKYLSVHKVEML